jgi:hypothetical protein
MATTIVQNIYAISDYLRDNPDGGAEERAKELQQMAVDAMFHGIGSPQWKTYMEQISTNDFQLTRLTGKEEAFMKMDWGPLTLAYLVANGNCSMDSFFGTTRDFDKEMRARVDRIIPPAEDNA